MIVAIGIGGAAAVWLAMRSGAAGGSGPSTLWPRVIGGQAGVQSRSSSRTSDAGQLATQVIGDVIGQKTALAESADQLKIAEDQLTTEQNIAYRQSNVATQLSLNQEQPPPNGWTQIFQSLIGAAGSFFGGPVGAGALGITPASGGGMNWWNPFSWFGSGAPGSASTQTPPWAWGYYPYQQFSTPYTGGTWA